MEEAGPQPERGTSLADIHHTRVIRLMIPMPDSQVVYFRGRVDASQVYD